ncbi:MAG: hypothetical protein K8F25_16745 [Fimbriimonadaceae bacterium]|nr:hypothetical protein [Alphaproteobacteria bacterium]
MAGIPLPVNVITKNPGDNENPVIATRKKRWFRSSDCLTRGNAAMYDRLPVMASPW